MLNLSLHPPAASSARASSPIAPLRLAVVRDYAEEHWPSMNLAAEMLVRELQANHADRFEVSPLQPAFRHRVTTLPFVGRAAAARNADRLINRMHDYPRWLARCASAFDRFHIADHSYAHLVHVLPADATGVFCHDLDTFRCLFDPVRDLRPRWFRAIARRILSGLQKARVVFHPTVAVRDEIIRHSLVDESRLVLAPNGVADEFTAAAGPSIPSSPLAEGGPYLLHVGSCIARKRIDVLLKVFAAARKVLPSLRLMQVGGEWSDTQRRQIDRLAIHPCIVQLREIERTVLADLYRRAAAVLCTSEAEGFGLPVAEGLACGAMVIASDVPALREVGGDAAVYCAVGDIDAWVARLTGLLSGREEAPSVEARIARGGRFSRSAQARIIADTYAKS